MNYEYLREEFIKDQPWQSKTIVWGRRMINKFLIWSEAEGIAFADLNGGKFNRLLNQLRNDGYSHSMQAGVYNVTSSFYRWLYQNGHIDHNIFADRETRPKRPREPRRVVRTVHLHYIEAIMRAASVNDSPMSRRDRAIIALLISTGMRRAEVANLSLMGIDFQTGEILLTATKNRDERFVFLADWVADILQLWLDVRPSGLDHDKVFITLSGSSRRYLKPLAPTAINHLFRKLKVEAGIPKEVLITPHLLRHTYATEIAKHGDAFTLAKLLGHASIRTTQIYVHVDKETLRQVSKFAPKVG